MSARSSDERRGSAGKPLQGLPDSLPILPLAGILLLPRCRLSLDITEPRYQKMTDDALAADGLIGMVQPVGVDEEDEIPVYPTGCAGRVASVSRTAKGHYLVLLAGFMRFDVREELERQEIYRQIRPGWDPYLEDVRQRRPLEIDRDRLLELFGRYLKVCGFETDWEAIEASNDELLVNSLAMLCPFDPDDKQALLHAHATERGELLLRILEIAVAAGPESATARSH